MNILKIIGGLIATVFLGAIGSGLWERFLSPFFDSLQLKIAQAISSIYSGYLDSIYEDAAQQLSGRYVNGDSSILILYIVAVILLLISIHNTKWYKDLNYSFIFHGFLNSGLLFVATFYFGIQQYYVKEICSYSFLSMEILRPYIGDKEYNLLKSNYYQVKNENDFKTFEIKIRNYSKKYNITIPKSNI